MTTVVEGDSSDFHLNVVSSLTFPGGFLQVQNKFRGMFYMIVPKIIYLSSSILSLRLDQG